MTYPCGRVPLSALPTRSRVCRALMSCHSVGKEPAMGHAPGSILRNAEGQSAYVIRAKAAEVSQRRQRGRQQPCRKSSSVHDRAACTPS